ncbi:MAG: glycosyltransferase [Planctomycetota bacterium]
MSGNENTRSPRLSVILPCYNRAEELSTCLRSLAAQTVRDVEFIVIDDASSDPLDTVLEEARVAFAPRPLVALRNDRNSGANASRNRGLEVSRGELLAFIDSDCIAQPDWLERLAEPFADDRVVGVTGLVEDDPAQNIYERVLLGLHRVARRGRAHRIVACNMCVRASAVKGFRFDTDAYDVTRGQAGEARGIRFSGRCDEESLNLHLRRMGRVLAEPSARITHVHRYTWVSFRKQAFHGGQGAAEFVWRYRLPPRIDVLPWILGYAALPIALILAVLMSPWVLVVPAALFGAGIAAIGWNELRRKGRRLSDLPAVLPMLLVYYQLRVAGYARMSLMCLFKGRSADRRA